MNVATGHLGVVIDRLELMYDERDSFAKSDGFTNWEDFCAFWLSTHGKKSKPLVFQGDMIHWAPAMSFPTRRKTTAASKSTRPNKKER